MSEQKLYFLKQKAIGVFLIILTIIAIHVLEGDATIAFFTVPIGMTLIFSKKKCWVDHYYFEDEDNTEVHERSRTWKVG